MSEDIKTKSKPRYVAKTMTGYISKRGTSYPKEVDSIDKARIYLRAGDAWQMARRWDKNHKRDDVPFQLHTRVVEVFIVEGEELQDPKYLKSKSE